MALLFWDASALVKRYTLEAGSDAVDEVFRAAEASSMAVATIGYAETFSILHRRMNGGLITPDSFNAAVALLASETVANSDFRLMHASDAVVFDSLQSIQRHNLNSTDAILLTLLLTYCQSPEAERCVVIASDRRLLRAAVTEGLMTLNPEEVAVSDVAGVIAAL